MEEILKLLRIKDENGDFLRHAPDVAKYHGVHRNAVYAERKKTARLDRLMAYDEAMKAVEALDSDIAGGLTVEGSGEAILGRAKHILEEGRKYRVVFIEEKENEDE